MIPAYYMGMEFLGNPRLREVQPSLSYCSRRCRVKPAACYLFICNHAMSTPLMPGTL